MPMLTVDAVADKAFDYIVIGGGTAGLTLAARLSEESSVSVLVLEAGQANLNDPKITMPAQFGQTFGNDQYDWQFSTVKQKLSGNREFGWNRGKGLGGTSGMNFYCWSKPPKMDYDVFERLGNPGWNWSEFAKYSRKSENFHLPSKEVMDAYPHTYDPDHRGISGPIHLTIAPHVHTMDKLMQDTLANKGIKVLKDPYTGDTSGAYMTAANLNPNGWKRSYSANAYLEPNLHRTNLNVLTEALVSRIVFNEAVEGADVTASAVEFVVGDKLYTVKVKKEAIVSCGTINSPKVLELSGIGRKDVLSSIGVETKVELPGVGENVQEHIFFPMSFELDESKGVTHQTLHKLLDPERAAKELGLYAEGKGLFRTAISSFSFLPIQRCDLPETPAIIALAEKDVAKLKATKVPGIGEQADIWLEMLKDEQEPDLEIVALPWYMTASKAEATKSYVTLLGLLNHPITRGTIHAQSKDPKVQPTIDPHYFEYDSDMEMLVQHFKYIRTWKDVEPWKSGTVCEVDPGLKCQTDDEIREYIRNSLSTTWHTVGSCSMLPRAHQGVVDPKLKVYGTTNVRVVDISIIPLHIAAHTQTSAYVIGEKAADIIKSGLTHAVN